jgi:hypothetical protein
MYVLITNFSQPSVNMAGGEQTNTPVKEQPMVAFTEDDKRRIRGMAENIVAEKIRRMGGGVRYCEKQQAFEEAKKEAMEWARTNDIGSWRIT